MNSYRFTQLDVFTTEPFAGNSLAVFPEAAGLSDDQMMKIAREMNLSETVFVLAPDSNQQSVNSNQPANQQVTAGTGPNVLRRLRIFTPTREIPFAGHPIVGTWNALAREGIVPLPEGGDGWTRIYHEVGIGVLPVDIEFKDGAPVQVVMTQGKFEIRGEIDDTQELNYPAIMKAIAETGFKGYVAHEFTPRRDPLESLTYAARICDV
jgi:trans-2,3-dihydro-3-hydroxyanthranilate isomerase